jgi:uncharacterized membrane protein
MIRNNNNISKQTNKWFHILLLLSWLAIGISLRFTNLGEKSPSSIEISTLGFSLGHGFLQVPLDRVISLDRLLLPLRFDATTTPSDVMHHLIGESNHPPLYFVLTHLWLKLFLHNGELASLWIGRSLSAILGAVSIPAMFGLGWLAFRSLLVAQIAAALMAVSPYGIYLAQEARHYTLTILWIVASLSCLIVAVRCIYNRTALPVWIGCAWIIVNCLGFATHYFYSLAMSAEGLVIGGFWLRDFRVWLQSKSEKINSIVSTKFPNTSEYWRRIYLVAALSAIGCLVWLPVIQSSSHNELTEWIETSFDLDQIWQPIPRLLGWWITMVFLLPVEGTNLAVTAISSLVVLVVLLWVSPAVMRGILSQMASLSPRLSIQVLGGFAIGAIAIFVTIIYGLGRDLSQAARYHFVYFPSAIVLLAAAVAICWRESVASRDVCAGRLYRISVVPKARGKKVVVVILLMGLLGAFTVVSNYGYQKSRRSDLLASHIQATSTAPMLIAMTYETHAELRALTGLAVDFKRLAAQEVEPRSASATFNSPEFLLVHRKNHGSTIPSALATILTQLPRPLDLWAVNLKVDSNDIEALNCHRDSRKPNINGYRYRLYRCR